MLIKINIVLKAILLSGFLSLVACDTTDPDENNEEMIVLNLETLEAETEFGTLEAWRAEESFVGEINEGQVIGVAFLEDDDGEDENSEIVVYLYDRHDLAVMIGEVDDGEATLESGDLSDFDATVDLTIEDNTVSGAATFLDEESTPFTANAASGDAGVYWAGGTDENPDLVGDWVVLPDGRQWGCVCHPPFASPCCTLHL